MTLPGADRRLVDALGQASSLELYRLNMMIQRMLTDPRRIIEMRRLLHLGQQVRFLDSDSGQMRAARVVELKDTDLVVQDQETLRHWRLAYAAVEPPDVHAEGVDHDCDAAAPSAQAQAPTARREDFQRGQKVSFEDKHLRTQVGVITRINQRTASIDTDDAMLWKVSFALLRHVVDV